jgi:hypothetical protein
MRKRPLANLNNSLLDKLVRTGMLNICFTERQKLSLLHVAGIAPSESMQTPMLDTRLVAVGLTSEPTTVYSGLTYNRQGLIPILSELPCGQGDTFRVCADNELAGITRAVARFRSQGELMRVVGARIDGGGRGMNILPRHFNPGVGLGQVHLGILVNLVNDCSLVVERSGTLLDRLRGGRVRVY